MIVTLWITHSCLLLIGAALGLWSLRVYQNTLTLKAKDQSAECIDGKFYYIVPESEYVELIKLKHKVSP